MGIAIFNLSLSQSIATAVRELQIELFRLPAPRVLHHYTRSAETVKSIIERRELWATSVADQTDQFEISHAARLVERVTADIQKNAPSRFAVDVLQRLPFFMEERKRWIFIACFCDDGNSEKHWRDYGEYRITFSTPWTGSPSLRLGDPKSECWYQPVIYDERVQQKSVQRALRSIVRAISENTQGDNEGPWARAIVDSCARNTAQLLLGLGTGFKRSSYADEREWRIVCSPLLGSNNSAPSWIDENFKTNIARTPRAHVSLQITRQWGIFEPVMIPPVPIIDWSWNPHNVDRLAVENINEAFRSNGRPDLVRSLPA